MNAYIVYDILTDKPFIVHGHCGDYYPMWDNPIAALSYIDMLDKRLGERCEVREVVFAISRFPVEEKDIVNDETKTKTEDV